MGRRSLLALDPICDVLILSGRSPTPPGWPGTPCVGDREGNGPFGGLLDAMEMNPSRVVVTMPCDMPRFDAAHCSALLDGLDISLAEAVFAHDGHSIPQWLVGAWKASSILEHLVKLYEQGTRSIEEAARAVGYDLVLFEPQTLLNVNEVSRQ